MEEHSGVAAKGDGMSVLILLEKVYEEAERVIANVSPDDMQKPTPCDDWAVRDLLNHTISAVALLPTVVRNETADWSQDFLGSDPAASFRAAATANLAAWRIPGALDTPGPEKEEDGSPLPVVPGAKLVYMNLVDTFVHTTDLAKATGQTPDFDPNLAKTLLAAVQAIPFDSARASGAFGTKVEISEEAPPVDRLLAFLGRRP